MNFFKKIFLRGSSNIELNHIELNHIELKGWLEEISEKRLSSVNTELKERLSKIKGFRHEMKEKLDILEKAELLNSNIPEREKHIMQGNRLNYIKGALSFIESTNIGAFNYISIEVFCSAFDENLMKLNEETAKGYYVLKNFFDKEMTDIATSLRSLESEVKAIKNILSSDDITAFKNLSLEIRAINEGTIEANKLAKEIGDQESELLELENQKAQFNTKSLALKEGSDYQRFRKAEKQISEIDKKLSELNDNLNNAFKAIDKPLKKYHHETKVDIVSDYLKLPLVALEKDQNYAILKVISELKLMLEKNNDKGKAKKIKAADALNKEFLFSIKKKHEQLKAEKQEWVSKLEKLSVMRDIKELEYQLRSISAKIERYNAELEPKRKAFSGLNLEEKRKSLETSLSEFSGMIVKILAPKILNGNFK